MFDYKKASNLEMIMKILIYENNKFMMAFSMVMKIYAYELKRKRTFIREVV